MQDILTLVLQCIVGPLLVAYCKHKWFKEKDR